MRWLAVLSLTCPYPALQRALASAHLSASVNVFTIACARSGLRRRRCRPRGRVGANCLVRSSCRFPRAWGALEDQPVAVLVSGRPLRRGANSWIGWEPLHPTPGMQSRLPRRYLRRCVGQRDALGTCRMRSGECVWERGIERGIARRLRSVGDPCRAGNVVFGEMSTTMR